VYEAALSCSAGRWGRWGAKDEVASPRHAWRKGASVKDRVNPSDSGWCSSFHRSVRRLANSLRQSGRGHCVKVWCRCFMKTKTKARRSKLLSLGLHFNAQLAGLITHDEGNKGHDGTENQQH